MYYNTIIIHNSEILLSIPKGTKLLLFLKAGTSPFTENGKGFVPSGAFQGIYTIDKSGYIKITMSDNLRKTSFKGAIREIEKNYDINNISEKFE